MSDSGPVTDRNSWEDGGRFGGGFGARECHSLERQRGLALRDVDDLKSLNGARAVLLARGVTLSEAEALAVRILEAEMEDLSNPGAQAAKLTDRTERFYNVNQLLKGGTRSASRVDGSSLYGPPALTGGGRLDSADVIRYRRSHST